MSDSIETKIREALLYRLGGITVANGYVNNIGDIFDDFPENPEDINDFPAVVALLGFDTRSSLDNEMLYLTARATLLAFVNLSGSVVVETETIKQDIQRMLGLYPSLQDSGGDPTCQLAVYGGAEPFGRVFDVPMAPGRRGTRITVEIRYQQALTDPTEG